MFTRRLQGCAFKFVLSQVTASKIIFEESLSLTQKINKNNNKTQVMASLLLHFN